MEWVNDFYQATFGATKSFQTALISEACWRALLGGTIALVWRKLHATGDHRHFWNEGTAGVLRQKVRGELYCTSNWKL